MQFGIGYYFQKKSSLIFKCFFFLSAILSTLMSHFVPRLLDIVFCFLKLSFLFAFQLGKSLDIFSSLLMISLAMPTCNDHSIKGILHFSYSDDFQHLLFFFLKVFSYLLSAYSNHLFLHVICFFQHSQNLLIISLNFLSDNSKICIISKSDSVISFVSSVCFSCLLA